MRHHPAKYATRLQVGDDNPPVNRVFILPASFDPIELLPRPLHKFADDGRYIVSTILRKTARGQADDCGYVPLRAEYLRNVISKRKCREIVESLQAAEAIHRTPRVRVDRRARETAGYAGVPGDAETAGF